MPINLSLASTLFNPSDTVSGTVTWDMAGRKSPKIVIVRLLWFTEGKGSKNSMVVEQKRIAHPNPLGSDDFALKLPNFPWSYEGKLLTIQWVVEAQMNKEKASPIKIICGPNQEAIKGLTRSAEDKRALFGLKK